MKKLFTFFLLVSGLFAHAQEEHGNYASKVSEFMALYNGNNYEGIFMLFDDDMKKALPREKTLRFFSENVKHIMGDISTMNFTGLQKGAHSYRTVFEKSSADILISLNAKSEINGLFISSPKPLDITILERNTTAMILPFREQWFVFWGGNNAAQNYHVNELSQQYAYDMLMVKDGASYLGDSKKNENYFVFGKEIIAPCDGRIVKVVKGVKDNVPGELNPEQLTGNTIVLQTENDEYVLFAHLKESSITVEEGNDVRQGDVLAQCGNSGNSTEPHLHLSLQNTVAMEDATGAKLYFDRIQVNGEIKEDYIPVKEDFVQNIN